MRTLSRQATALRSAGGYLSAGLRDPHVHLCSMAAARMSIDCSPCRSIGELLALLSDQDGLNGEWLRAWGYDEALLRELRPPTLAELDSVVPHRPLVLHHLTGHVILVNSAARSRLGLGPGPGLGQVELSAAASLDPAVNRRLLSGTSTITAQDLDTAAEAMGRDLVGAGLVGVTDATETNGVSELELLSRWRTHGLLQVHVSALVAADQVSDVVEAGVDTDRCVEGVRVEGAKVSCAPDEVSDAVSEARRYGWPVAIHAVDVEELSAALSAIEAHERPMWGVDRIEHAGLVLPEQHDRLLRAGVTVVTNPSFLAARGSKYLAQLSEVERTWLYPVQSLIDAGIPVVAASDAPVTAARPLLVAMDACRRTVRLGTDDGAVLGPGERVQPSTAMMLVSTGPERLTGASMHSNAGRSEDFVILDREPVRSWAHEREQPNEVFVLATVIDGEVVYLHDSMDEMGLAREHDMVSR